MLLLRRAVPYLWGAVAVVLLQLGWVFLSRHRADEQMEQGVRARRERAEARSAPLPSGTAVRIPWFYANSGEVVRGQQVVFCYGVENAVSVRLEPPVEQLSPAFNRCFAVAPQVTTSYTLIARGKDAEVRSGPLRIEVQPPPPTILFVTISEKEIRRGEPWIFCYGVRNAASVRLEPLGMKLAASEKKCLRLYPVRSADFVLIAGDELGRTDREKLRLTVR